MDDDGIVRVYKRWNALAEQTEYVVKGMICCTANQDTTQVLGHPADGAAARLIAYQFPEAKSIRIGDE